MEKIMTDFDLKLCDVQGRLFVLSVTQGYGSNKFVKNVYEIGNRKGTRFQLQLQAMFRRRVFV